MAVLAWAFTALALAGARPAAAAEVRVLSAAAVMPGLERAAELYRGRSGDTVTVTITYATGPEIAERIGGGERGFDVVVAPEPVLAALAAKNMVMGEPVRLGAVGISLAVRHGVPVPDLHDAAAFRRALLSAKAVVISRGSTGVYLDGVFARMGMVDPLGARLERERNGEGVVQRLLAGGGAEYGLSATTELAAGASRGVDVVATLPPELQMATPYAAAATEAAGRQEAAGLLALLRGPEGRAAMAANGIR